MKVLKVLFSMLVLAMVSVSFSTNAQSIAGDDPGPCDGQFYYLCNSWYPQDGNGGREGFAGDIATACPNGGSFEIEWLDC